LRFVLTAVGLFLFIVAGAGAQAAPDQAPAAVAVMDFDNRSPSGQWPWLGRGLADMIVTDLSASGRLVILEREKLNDILRELDLGATGLVDPATASHVGRLARVDWVLYGSFLKKADALKIEAHLLDLRTQKLLRVEWVKGSADEVFKLEKALVRRILDRLHVRLTDEERRSLEYVPTDSIPAFEHYSQSLAHFDEGRWHEALLECRLAVRADGGFLKAAARLAAVYRQLGEPEHAVVEYRKLIEADRENVLPESVYYKMGRVLEDDMHDAAGALAAYEKLLARYPAYDGPHEFHSIGTFASPEGRKAKSTVAAHALRLRAIERVALIHERQGNEFEAARRYSQIVSFLWRQGVPYAAGGDITWGDLRDRVLRKYGPMYWRFVRENRDAGLCPPYGLSLIPEEGRSFGGDIPPRQVVRPPEMPAGAFRPRATASATAVCLAPLGKEIAELTISVDCETIGPEDQQHAAYIGWTEKGAGGRSGRETFDIGTGWQTAHFEMPPGVRAARIGAAGVPRWKANVTLRPWRPDADTAPETGPEIGFFGVDCYPELKAVFIDGEGWPEKYKYQPGATYRMAAGDHVVEVLWPGGERASKKFRLTPGDQMTMFFITKEIVVSRQTLPARGTNTFLLADRNGRLWLLWDHAFETHIGAQPSQESDLFCANSIDGVSWSVPRRLSVSSPALDARPILQQDSGGTYWLVWFSSRDPEDTSWFWIASSEDGSKWSFPRKVILPNVWKGSWGATHVPVFAFAIDERNAFFLAAAGCLFRSENSHEWTEFAKTPYEHKGDDKTWRRTAYSLVHDDDGRMALLGQSFGSKRPAALFRPGNATGWEKRGSPVGMIRVDSGCLVSDIDGRIAAVFMAKRGVVLKSYDDAHGWSEGIRIEPHSSVTMRPTLARRPDGRFVVACNSNDGIVALVCNIPPFEPEKQ